jgi:hypothetical protein
VMSFLEKANSRVVHLLFPFVERISLFIPFVVLIAVWSIPEAYWPIRVILVWIWFMCNEIQWKGAAERDCLPLQPGNGLFYTVYRLISDTAFLFLLIMMIVVLVPLPLLPKGLVLGVYVATMIPRTIGDQKYRPRRPEE